MTLKQQMKWRLNDIGKLSALPMDGDEAKALRKLLFVDFTAPCAAEIMGAKPDSPLYKESRKRRFWVTLGYVIIVVFLASVAALVLGYWLLSDKRVPWITRDMLLILLAAIATEVGLMLLCARQVTVLQNHYAERCIEEIQREFAALPEEDRARFPRLLRQEAQRGHPDRKVGCCACGALFPFGEIEQSDDSDPACPRCGAQYQLIFEGEDAPLDEDILNRLRSFMEA